MTPGYVHASKRESQAVAQLKAVIEEKSRLLAEANHGRADAEGKLKRVEERLRNLAKGHGILAAEVQSLRSRVQELEAQCSEPEVECG